MIKKATTRKQWDNAQVRALLALYIDFMTHELNGEHYVKAPAVRDLAARLERTKGSIEAKMMNVSAVLRDHGKQYINGYKPLPNYNKALVDQVRNMGLI